MRRLVHVGLSMFCFVYHCFWQCFNINGQNNYNTFNHLLWLRRFLHFFFNLAIQRIPRPLSKGLLKPLLRGKSCWILSNYTQIHFFFIFLKFKICYYSVDNVFFSLFFQTDLEVGIWLQRKWRKKPPRPPLPVSVFWQRAFYQKRHRLS